MLDLFSGSPCIGPRPPPGLSGSWAPSAEVGSFFLNSSNKSAGAGSQWSGQVTCPSLSHSQGPWTGSLNSITLSGELEVGTVSPKPYGQKVGGVASSGKMGAIAK